MRYWLSNDEIPGQARDDKKRYLLIAIILTAFAANSIANITTTTESKSGNKLREIQNSIRTVEHQLQTDRGKLQNLQGKLREVEVKISERAVSLRNLNRRLKQTKKLIKKIDTKIKVTAKLRQRQATQLTKQIETQYTMRKQSPLKLLLNQEDPLQVRRMFTYLDYINQARLKDIKGYNQTLSKLSTLEERAKIALNKAKQLYQFTQQEKLALDREYSRRTTIVAAIKQSLHNNESRLADLRKDEQRLKELVAKIGSALSDIPAQLEQKYAFRTMQGKLPWPTTGKIAKRFGSKLFNSSLRTNGIIIAAPQGQQVRTIHSGRVAYADWLRGFGLLIIVDHGDGYMTLYAHNQTLYKEIGDWVEPREIIATVGKTGGADKPGLYFEVRKNGRPVNPLAWVSKTWRSTWVVEKN